MRGKITIWKKTLLLASIALFLLAVLPVGLVFAGTTTLAAPDITDVTKTPGSSFYIDITVADVSAMWGFDITLEYDITILTATGYSSYSPFMMPWPSEINTGEGYVKASYSMMLGELVGFSTIAPAPILRIDFDVIDSGASQLNLDNTEISDIYGEPIPHAAVDGSFRNIAGAPLADFYYTPSTPIERETATFTSTSIDIDGFIVAEDWDFGDGNTGTGGATTHSYRTAGTYTVTLTVTDNDGKTDSSSDTIEVLSPPHPIGVDLRESKADSRRFDVSVRDPDTSNTFTAWVKSLNTKEDTLVRIVWSIWEFPAMQALGSIEAEVSIGPKDLARFTADFDVFDDRWGFDGSSKMNYEVRTEIYYVDFYLPGGFPHWEKGTVNSEKGTEWFSVTTLP